MRGDRFVKGTERLVDPITVGSAHFMQQLIGRLPLRMQSRMLEGASKSTPYMGFVVEPYAFFLFYELRDPTAASHMLPEGFQLAETSIFEGDEPKPYAIISFFRVHTSTFWGARAEFYLTAKDTRTGLLSWVMTDYLSDTIGYDRASGLRGPSAPRSVITTTADGRVMVDMADAGGSRRAAFDVPLGNAQMRPLDARLWIEGNLSVAYGPMLSPGDAGVFSLTFSPEEMSSAYDVPVSDLRIGQMSWHEALIESAPSRAVCFPYAQHLLSDTPGASSGLTSPDDLEHIVQNINFETMPTFSTASVRRGMARGGIVSLGAIIALLVALAIT